MDEGIALGVSSVGIAFGGSSVMDEGIALGVSSVGIV